MVDQVFLVLNRILHFEFACLLKPSVGCAKMGFKIYSTLLKWIHQVLGFNCVLEFPWPVNNRVGDVGRLGIGVQGYCQFPVFLNIFDLVEKCVNRGLWVILH